MFSRFDAIDDCNHEFPNFICRIVGTTIVYECRQESCESKVTIQFRNVLVNDSVTAIGNIFHNHIVEVRNYLNHGVRLCHLSSLYPDLQMDPV